MGPKLSSGQPFGRFAERWEAKLERRGSRNKSDQERSCPKGQSLSDFVSGNRDMQGFRCGFSVCSVCRAVMLYLVLQNGLYQPGMMRTLILPPSSWSADQ